MRVVYVEPYEEAKIIDMDDSLESMQGAVGGCIEMIRPFADGEVALICNDEGKIRGFTPNRALMDEQGEIYDIVFGSFFICAAPYTSEKLEGLSWSKARHYLEMLKTPELVLLTDDGVVVLKLD